MNSIFVPPRSTPILYLDFPCSEERGLMMWASLPLRGTVLEQANSGKRSLDLPGVRVRKLSKKSQQQRRAPKTRSRVQQTLDLDRLPAVGNEKIGAFLRTEFECRACFFERLPRFPLHHRQQPR